MLGQSGRPQKKQSKSLISEYKTPLIIIFLIAIVIVAVFLIAKFGSTKTAVITALSLAAIGLLLYIFYYARNMGMFAKAKGVSGRIFGGARRSSRTSRTAGMFEKSFGRGESSSLAAAPAAAPATPTTSPVNQQGFLTRYKVPIIIFFILIAILAVFLIAKFGSSKAAIFTASSLIVIALLSYFLYYAKHTGLFTRMPALAAPAAPVAAPVAAAPALAATHTTRTSSTAPAAPAAPLAAPAPAALAALAAPSDGIWKRYKVLIIFIIIFIVSIVLIVLYMIFSSKPKPSDKIAINFEKWDAPNPWYTKTYYQIIGKDGISETSSVILPIVTSGTQSNPVIQISSNNISDPKQFIIKRSTDQINYRDITSQVIINPNLSFVDTNNPYTPTTHSSLCNVKMWGDNNPKIFYKPSSPITNVDCESFEMLVSIDNQVNWNPLGTVYVYNDSGNSSILFSKSNKTYFTNNSQDKIIVWIDRDTNTVWTTMKAI